MRTKLAILGLSAGLVGGGAAGFALTGTSGVAGAQDDTTTTTAAPPTSTTAPTDGAAPTTTAPSGKAPAPAKPDRTARLNEVLAPLVTDGTITQAQADKVIAALEAAGPPDGGHGGPGHGGRGGPGLDAAAKALGLTTDELRTKLQAGTTIAQVAKDEGVDLTKVTDAMLAAEKERLAADVAAGRITQAQADEHLTEETAEITARVNGEMPAGGHGH